MKLTVRTFELLEELNELDGPKEIRVLCCYLHDYREVLPHVGAQHLLHTSEGLFHSKASEISDEPLSIS